MNHRHATPAPPAPEVRLHIEHLVIEGLPFAPGDSVHLEAALHRELGRLAVAVPVEAWQSRAVPRAAAPPVTLAAGGSPDAWAGQLARSVAAAVAPPPSTR